MITIDSISYDLPFKTVKRKADLLFKDGTGRTEDGTLHGEVIGTYYNFDVQVGMSANNVTDYAALWLKITDPSWQHEITMPTESGDLTFDCYFAAITDEIKKWNEGGTNYFRNLSFSIIAISPARTP